MNTRTLRVVLGMVVGVGCGGAPFEEAPDEAPSNLGGTSPGGTAGPGGTGGGSGSSGQGSSSGLGGAGQAGQGGSPVAGTSGGAGAPAGAGGTAGGGAAGTSGGAGTPAGAGGTAGGGAAGTGGQQMIAGQAGASGSGMAGTAGTGGAGQAGAPAAGGSGTVGGEGGEADAGQAGAPVAGAGGQAGQGGAGQAGAGGAAGEGGGGQAGAGTCELGARQCGGLQPEICDGETWNPNGGLCTYGCDQASLECVCQGPAGRFVATTHGYKYDGPLGAVSYLPVVKDTVTGLIWLNAVTASVPWGQAAEFCVNNNGRLPTRAEVGAVEAEQYPAITCAYNLPDPFAKLGSKAWTADAEPAIEHTRYAVDMLTAKESLLAEGDIAPFRCVHDPF